MKHAKRLLAGVLAALLLSTTLAPTERPAKQKAATLAKPTMVIRVLACYTK